MKNNFRFLTLILFPLLFLLLSGCWDYTEYEDMTLLAAIGFDHGQNGQITLTSLYTPITGGPGSGGAGGGQEQSRGAVPPMVVNQVSSATISCAIDSLQQIVPKQIFLGNIGLIVISDEITPADMRSIVSFLDTTQYIRPSTLVAVSKGKAGDFLATQSTTGATPLRINELISNTVRSGSAIPVTILQLMQALDREGFEPILPGVEAEAQPETSETKDSGGSGRGQNANLSLKLDAGSSGASNAGTNKPILGLIKPKMGNFKISGLAVFKGYKMVGQLDETETRGVIWINHQRFNGHVCVNNQEQRDITVIPKAISFRISDFRTQRKIILKNGMPQVFLNVKTNAILEEFRYFRKTLPPAFLKTIEKNLADSIKRTMEKSITKAQSLRSDIFGFGFDFFQQHLKAWKRTYRNRWDKMFPELPVHIKVKVRILTTGTKIPSIIER